MLSHPPIFAKLAERQSPFSEIARLARRVAFRESQTPEGRARDNARIQKALDRHRTPAFPNYRPEERDCS